MCVCVKVRMRVYLILEVVFIRYLSVNTTEPESHTIIINMYYLLLYY